MANEIKVKSVSNGGGQQKFELLFYYTIPVAQRITNPLTSSPHVPTPTADMDAETLALLVQAEKDALDAGTAVLEPHTLTIPAGASAATVLAEARASYAGKASNALTVYTARYTHKNKQFDKE